MILDIKRFPEPILTMIAKPVEKVTPDLVKLADDMLETMYAAPGIGLAAPQVGKSIRLVVIDSRIRDDDDNVDVSRQTILEKQVSMPLRLFNPVIVAKEGRTTYEEGCLSVPGFAEEVVRANYVEVHGLNEKNEKVLIKTDGLLAICLQHELDHLDGKLFIDRLSTIKRGLIKTKIKNHGYPEGDATKQHLL